LGYALNKAHKGGSLGIHRAEGMFLQSHPECMSLIHAPRVEQIYMQEMVEARKNAEEVEERHDLFSGLLDAAQDEPNDGAAISEEELIGEYNVYQVYIARKRLDCYSRKHVHLSPRRA
jgi:hypothetical protein